MEKKFLVLIIILLFKIQLFSQTDQITFPLLNFDLNATPRTQLNYMSLKMFDDYHSNRPSAATAPGNNTWGTMLVMYGRANHWEHNLYFGADKKIYYRSSVYTSWMAEDGTLGGYSNWRTILDSKSDIESSGLLKLTGDGDHYLLNGKIGIGTTSPQAKLEVIGQDVIFYSNTAQNSFKMGRNANENFEFYVSDESGFLDYNQDTDENRPHIFYIRNVAGGTSPNNDIRFQTSNLDRMTIKDNGNVGIGITSPQSIFHLNSSTGSTILRMGATDNVNFESAIRARFISGNGSALDFGNYHGSATFNSFLSIMPSGNVGIGKEPACKLDVDGKIRAGQIEVIELVPGADYVFEDDYELLSIEQIEKFIKENKHLPEVPSAAEFKKNGYNIGQMDDLLLRKIEELTLYLIDQEKKIAEQQMKFKAQAEKQKALEARIKELENNN